MQTKQTFRAGDIVELVDAAYAADHNMSAYIGRAGCVKRNLDGRWGSYTDRDGDEYEYVSVHFDSSGADPLPQWLVEIGFDAEMTRDGTNLALPAFALVLRAQAPV